MTLYGRLLGIFLLLSTFLQYSIAFVPNYHKKRFNFAAMAATNKKKLYPFAEARRIARGHGFESKQEFIEYDCAGAYQLPKNADQVWSEEWTSWEDFLGLPLTFEEGRQVAQSLQLESKEEYLKLMERKTIDDNEVASRLPYRPDLKYKKEWISWNDWLGISS